MALIPEVRRCCTSLYPPCIGEEDAHNAHRTDSLLLALSQGKAPRPRTPPGSLSLSLFVCLSLLLALGQKARGLHARVRTGLAVCVTLLSSLLTSLHRGRVHASRPGPRPPLPPSSVEEAVGSSEVGDFPPTFGLAGSVCLVRTQPSLYFSPHPGLIPALTKAQSLAPHQAHSPCRNNGWIRWFPSLFKMKQQLKHKTYGSQGQTGSPAGQQP